MFARAKDAIATFLETDSTATQPRLQPFPTNPPDGMSSARPQAALAGPVSQRGP